MVIVGVLGLRVGCLLGFVVCTSLFYNEFFHLCEKKETKRGLEITKT